MKVDVAIPRTRFDFLTYNSSDTLQVGDLVLVPLRDKLKYGIVIKINSQRDVSGVRAVKELVKKRFIPINLVRLYKWMADYYLLLLGVVLKPAFPSRVLKRYKFIKKPAPPILAKAPTPTYHQSYAIRNIIRALQQRRFATFLLYGITGSGKTEVYLRCVEEVRRENGRALVLVPEISMTPLLFNRFKERFGDDVVTMHSGLSDKQRRELWYAIKNGEFSIVIGPRSTIFLPIPDLRLIIIDEEHDHSYKEHQQALKYNARDVAVMRGKIEEITVVLGSATPQIESYYNAGIGKYQLLTLKERIDARPLPQAEIIDLKKENRKFISPKLESMIQEALLKNEQVILFLNRRGFAPTLLCPGCGYVAKCPYCALPLVYHKSEKIQKDLSTLACHVCGYKSPVISICPKCGRGTLLYRGAGTQRIEEMVRKVVKKLRLNPEKKEPIVLRLDRDTVRKKGGVERILKAFDDRRARVLLGTQLVTKGFDFPYVTLVGIINADVILNLPDFRSSERTFQMLTQVAGRSGRGERPGRVLIQTFHPEQYSIIFSQLQNYPKFYAQELKFRKELSFPPFVKLILLRLSGKKEDEVWQEANRLYGIIKKIKETKVYGPNRSFYYKIRKNYRVYILMKVRRNFPHRRLNFLKRYNPKGCKFEIDVDPVDLL